MTLTPEIERYGASGRVNYTLTDYASLFVDTSYRKMNTHSKMAPTPAFGDLNTDTWGTLPASNAFNPLVRTLHSVTDSLKQDRVCLISPLTRSEYFLV